MKTHPREIIELLTEQLDHGYSAAAERERQHPPNLGMGRVRMVIASLVLVAIGLLLAVAYRHTTDRSAGAKHTKDALVTRVERSRHDTDALQKRAAQLRTQVTKEQDAALAGTAAGAEAVGRLRDLATSGGQASVVGPGLVVEVADGPRKTDPVTGKATARSAEARIRDQDLTALVNALWRCGAEAIAINGQRLSTVSTIRNAGEAILVDLRPVTSPYRIESIGAVAVLRRSFTNLDIAHRFTRYVKTYGMKFQVIGSGQLRLPSTVTPPLRYARPAS